jgi:phage-related protein
MPRVEVTFFREEDGTVPLLEWLDAMSAKPRDKCYAALERLEEHGHELRRPVADYLRDDIYELRVRFGSVNYRMLYFFHGREAVVVSHGLVKEQRVPPREIDLAVKRRQRFKAHRELHTFRREQ